MAGTEQAQRQPEPLRAGAAHDRHVHDPEAYGKRARNGTAPPARRTAEPSTCLLLGSAAMDAVTWVIELGVGSRASRSGWSRSEGGIVT